MEQIQSKTAWYWLTDLGFCLVTSEGRRSKWADYQTWPPTELLTSDCIVTELWVRRRLVACARPPWRHHQLWQRLDLGTLMPGVDVVRVSPECLGVVELAPDAPEPVWSWLDKAGGCRLIPEAEWCAVQSPGTWLAGIWSSGSQTVVARRLSHGVARVSHWPADENDALRQQQWLFREALDRSVRLVLCEEGADDSAP